MKRTLTLIAIIALFGYRLLAQENIKIKEKAQLMADATVKGDYETFVSYCYPRLVTMAGGKDSLIKLTKKTMKGMDELNLHLKSFEIGEPGEIITIGERQFCILSQVLSMTREGTPFQTTSALLAVSEDKGSHWYFVASDGRGDKMIYVFFPEIKGKITIPQYGPKAEFTKPKQ